MINTKWSMMFQYVLLVFICSFVICSGCPCREHHPQYQYCSSDYVIKATVTESTLIRDPETPAFDRLLYNVTVHNVYKESVLFPVRKHSSLFTTNPNHDTCGIILPVGTTYLITGYLRWNGLSISTCDFIVEYNSMSYIQKMGISGVYGHNCNCMTSNPTDYDDACHDRHGILYEDFDGECRWRVDMTQPSCSLFT